MSEMVERVAKAIAMSDPEYEAPASWTMLARAAIAAMREPTPKMFAAAWKVINPCNENCIEKFGIGPSVGEAWRAMIDAAGDPKCAPCKSWNSKGRGKMSAWQPIETATEIGKRILVTQKTPGDYGDCQCVAWLEVNPGRFVWDEDPMDETIRRRRKIESSTYWECPGFDGLIPTHWMPLPEPPSE